MDHEELLETDIAELESELCRLPDVSAVRVVADQFGHPTEIHVLAGQGKPAKQIVRDVQSIALASFGMDIDRRIVSVVQLPGDGLGVGPEPSLEVATRVRIASVQVHASGRRIAIRVTLGRSEDEATGFAEGTGAAVTRARMVATATLDALRQLDGGADALDVDTAQIVRVGAHDLAVVALVRVDSSSEESLVGAVVVRGSADDATVRATLDATNRRLPYLGKH